MPVKKTFDKKKGRPLPQGERGGHSHTALGGVNG
jgi:hypothetical protein